MEDRRGRSLLSDCLGRPRVSLAAAVGCGLIFHLALLGFPWVLAQAVDRGVIVRDVSAAVGWSGVVLLAVVVRTAAGMGLGWFSTVASSRAAMRLRKRLLEHLLTLDERAAGRFGHGDLATRGTRDVDAIATWVAGLGTLAGLASGILGILVAVSLLHPGLAVIAVAALPCLVAVHVYFPRRFRVANAALSAAHGARADAMDELLSAAAAVRGIGAEDAVVARHDARSAAVTEQTLRVARISATWTALSTFVPALATAAGLAVGGLAVLAGELTVGDLLAFAGWMTILWLWSMQLTGRVNELSQARTAAGRIAEVLACRPRLREAAVPVGLPEAGHLHAQSVVVDLGAGRLGPLDLRAGPGELVAVTGTLGSGKSTLARVLCRLDEPIDGTITYGGVDLRAAALADLRLRVCLVPQRPILLSTTIVENLTLGLDGVDLDEVRRACWAAAVANQIEALPDGYRTVVGEQGNTLSGGQLQRLALARALLRRPSVLVLDDVTSAVDVRTEQELLGRLRSWDPRMAVVVISHRDAVLDAADQIVDLSDGSGGVAAVRPVGAGGDRG